MACWMPMQEETLRKGPWLEEEDEQLATFVTHLGQRRWDFIARASGLKRNGKSCRLRWMNYLRPDLKHGQMSAEEEHIIFQLHERWGNKWSKIAQRLPGRTDNEIKNYWRTHLRKKALAQEQENLQREMDNATRSRKDYFQEEGDQSTQTTSFEYCGSVEEDVFGLSGVSFNAFGLSDHAFASSPYETRLSDWISGLPDDQSELKHPEECNLLDSWLSYPKWTSKNGDSMWEHCSTSLWNMEQTNTSQCKEAGDSFDKWM